ncbi:MAG TPA: GntR family transcriptional regulator [Candidatus Dormibacteraeota bacterium]
MDGTPSSAGAAPATLAEAAYRAIQDDVITCVLPPGARVTEAELCRRYQLGHTPIRSGLQRLQSEGLVEAEARHGWMVQTIRSKAILDSSAVRLLLEPEAASLAAGNLSPTLAERLRQLSEVTYDPSDPLSRTAYLRSNTELHSLVAGASGNARLASFVGSLLHSDERLFHFGFRLANYGDAVTHEHRGLVDALVAGDSREARRIAHQQITNTREVIMSGLLSAVASSDSAILAPAGPADGAVTVFGSPPSTDADRAGLAEVRG